MPFISKLCINSLYKYEDNQNFAIIENYIPVIPGAKYIFDIKDIQIIPHQGKIIYFNKKLEVIGRSEDMKNKKQIIFNAPLDCYFIKICLENNFFGQSSFADQKRVYISYGESLQLFPYNQKTNTTPKEFPISIKNKDVYKIQSEKKSFLGENLFYITDDALKRNEDIINLHWYGGYKYKCNLGETFQYADKLIDDSSLVIAFGDDASGNQIAWYTEDEGVNVNVNAT